MYFKKAKKDMIVLNKINGKQYKIVETNELTATATAVAIEEGIVVEEDTVEISEKNAICFKIVKFPVPEKEIKENFELLNGELWKGYQLIEQNLYTFKKILGVAAGKVILLTENNEVVTYSTERDRFEVIAGVMPETYIHLTSGTYQILLGDVYEEVEKEKEDSDSAEKEADPEKVFSYSLMILWNEDLREVIYEILDKPIGCSEEVIISSDGKKMYIQCDEHIFVIKTMEREEHFSASVSTLKNPENAGALLSVTAGVLTKNLVMFENLVVCEYGKIEKAGIGELLKGKYLVDLTYQKSSELYTFSSADMTDIVRVDVTETSDRGKLVSALTL